MLIGANGEPAGDFSLYASKCDLFKAGWKLFRPEAYDFNLVLEGATPSDDEVVDEADVECPDIEEEETDVVESEEDEEDEPEERRRMLFHAPLPLNSEEAKRQL